MSGAVGHGRTGNLPAETSSFVGRSAERTAVARALAAGRLVTLTGTGGVGKTRLALTAAADVRGRFADGVWLVDLSVLRSGRLLARTVASAFGVQEHTVRPELDVLAEFLSGQRALLVLDNCEHLTTACATLASELLAAAPELRILATSRRRLSVPGEHALAVEPLPVGPAPNGAGPDQVGDAVRLFTERAAANGSGFRLTGRNVETVHTLCDRLEGIPLALELAAARLRLLSPEQLLTRVEDRFRLLAGSGRSGPPRHETLRGAIGWSHELCTSAERLLWARLSVFNGGFAVEAAQQVCADAELTPDAVPDVLRSLAAKSIVRCEEGGGQRRFRLLDTVREYGLDRLRELGEEDALRERHLTYCLRLVRAAEHAWSGPRQLAWGARIGREHDNLRAALEYALVTPGKARAALELAARLWFFWCACGQLREGRDYLERAIALDSGPCRDRTRALWVCGMIAGTQVDIPTARALLLRAEREAAEQHDQVGHTFAVQWLGQVAFLEGDWGRAIDLLLRARAAHGPKAALNPGPIPCRVTLAAAWLARGRTTEAMAVLDEARGLCEEAGEIWMRAHLDWLLATADRARGRFSAAVSHAEHALWTQYVFHDIVGVTVNLEVLAGLTAAQLQAERAATLLGVADRIRRAYCVKADGGPFLADIRRQAAHTGRECLDEQAFRTAFERGAAMDPAEAVAYALGLPGPPPAPGPAAVVPARALTRREERIAVLIGEGTSPATVAGLLRLSRTEVESQLAAILGALNLSDPAQLAAWASARPLPDGDAPVAPPASHAT
ncbi:ATP-binding protein [Streptomyces sp. HUAS TT7]|uniref:ATP-binding protein n=1 Tax=Streptomyces sp. HUAS TT7 TaxID=3447507 RepID=UPI003F65EE94